MHNTLSANSQMACTRVRGLFATPQGEWEGELTFKRAECAEPAVLANRSFASEVGTIGTYPMVSLYPPSLPIPRWGDRNAIPIAGGHR